MMKISRNALMPSNDSHISGRIWSLVLGSDPWFHDDGLPLSVWVVTPVVTVDTSVITGGGLSKAIGGV